MPLSNEQIAKVVYEAIRQHEDLSGGGRAEPDWPNVRERMTSAVRFARELNPLDGPSALWNHIREKSDKDFDDMPLRIQEQVFLFRAIVTALTGWTDAPYGVSPLHAATVAAKAELTTPDPPLKW